MVKYLHFDNPMSVKWLFVLVLFISGKLYAQQYTSPRKASTGITVAIEIKDNRDLDYVKSNLRKFYGIQRVRINGPVDISNVAPVLELLDDLQDVQLVKFEGDFSDEVLLKLEWVENVSFYLRNGKEDKILMNNNLGKLNGLTLIFDVVPEDYYFMDALGQLRSLTLIAPFVRKEAEAAVAQAMKLKKLRKFGISLDRVDELPMQVSQWQELQKLTIIDNLSWILEKYTDNLSVLRRNITYQSGKISRNIVFEYLAQETDLFPWDINHIKSIWPGSGLTVTSDLSVDSAAISNFADFVQLRTPNKPVWDKNLPVPLINSFNDGEFYFTGNSGTDGVFYLGKDAVLLVPKNCFETTEGKSYDNVYALKCLWLNSPGELFTRAINLNFDSSRIQYSISPSGVFYLSAATDNATLKLKEGYFIKLVFRSRGDSADRFYAWNENYLKWQNYYDYDYKFDDSKIIPTDFHSFYGVNSTGIEVFGMDMSELSRRFEFEGYFYLLSPDEQRVSLENYGGFWVSPVQNRSQKNGSYTLRRGKGLIGLKKEFVDKRTEQGIVKFKIFDKTQTLFPELKAFSGYVFEVQTNMDPKEFSRRFIRGAVYCDVRIQQVGMSYEMALKTEEGIWKLKILTPGEKSKGKKHRYRREHRAFLRKFTRYQRILSNKEAALKDYLNSSHNSNIATARKEVLYPERNRMQPSAEFKIRSTGLFVWGKPVQQPDTFNLIVKFTDPGGIPFDVKNVFIAHRNPYSYRTYGSLENYNCVINPGLLDYIACVDSKGKVYILSGADFRSRNIKNNSFIYLAMNELPNRFRNVKELEKIIGSGK